MNYLKIDLDVNKRHFVFGDVHGMYYKVLELLDKVNYDPAGDMVYFCGDIIDRGPNSAQLIEEIIKNNNWWASRGNHEQMTIDTAFWYDDWYHRHGGRQTMESVELMGHDFQWLQDWCKSLPFMLDVGDGTDYDFTMIHAEWPRGVSYDQIRQFVMHGSDEQVGNSPLMWDVQLIRHIRMMLDPVINIDLGDRAQRQVIHGHYGLDKPLKYQNTWWIDGTVFKKINALEVISQQVHTVEFE